MAGVLSVYEQAERLSRAVPPLSESFLRALEVYDRLAGVSVVSDTGAVTHRVTDARHVNNPEPLPSIRHMTVPDEQLRSEMLKMKREFLRVKTVWLWSKTKALFRLSGDFGNLLQGNLTVLNVLFLLSTALSMFISQWFR